MVVLAGSMHETEEERGIAHFVEHMAFQKSKNAPDGHVFEAMERLGLRTGADTNASTTIDHTVYKLDLPNAEDETLESAFVFLRDVVDGLLFSPENVEAERRIMLREMDERSNRYQVRDRRLIRSMHWLEILNSYLKPEDLPDMLKFALSEWKRARKYGFSDLEFAAARNDLNTSYLERYLARLHQPAAAAADLMVESLVNQRITESPEDELNRARTDLVTLTRQECEAEVNKAWDQPDTRVIVTGATTPGTEEALSFQIQAIWKTPLQALPPDPPVRPLTIAPFGKIQHRPSPKLNQNPDYMDACFGNEVLVRLKPIPNLGGAVIIKVEAGWGRMAIPLNNPGLGAAAHLLAYWRPLEG